MIQKILGSVKIEDCSRTLEMKRLNQHLGTLNPSMEKFNSYRPVEALCGK
jgi:hypothetical protein